MKTRNVVMALLVVVALLTVVQLVATLKLRAVERQLMHEARDMVGDEMYECGSRGCDQ